MGTLDTIKSQVHLGQALLGDYEAEMMTRSESKQKRPSLSPLKVSQKYDALRNSQKLHGIVLKHDQIVLNHEHTTVIPFNLRAEQRCGEQKAAVYKKNEERYISEIQSSLRMSRSVGRAAERFTHFKEQDNMNHTVV